MTPPRSGWRLAWHVAGLTFGVLTALAGVAAVGVLVYAVVAFNSYGSNK